jgi:hypothetical protein
MRTSRALSETAIEDLGDNVSIWNGNAYKGITWLPELPEY